MEIQHFHYLLLATVVVADATFLFQIDLWTNREMINNFVLDICHFYLIQDHQIKIDK